MRELAGTRQGVSLAQVATEAPPIDTSSYAPPPQRRTRVRRLYAVTAPQPAEVDVLAEPIESENKLVRQVFYPSVKPRQMAAQHAAHSLTTEEFIQVRLATVRESTRHCFWPIDVLEKFLAADVITDISNH
jgi:hypothetical protein